MEVRDERFSRSNCKILVDHPEEVVVNQTEESNAILVELKVAPSDMGKVIGRQGRIAKAIELW